MAVGDIKNVFLRRSLVVLLAIPAIVWVAVLTGCSAALETRHVLKSAWRGSDL